MRDIEPYQMILIRRSVKEMDTKLHDFIDKLTNDLRVGSWVKVDFLQGQEPHHRSIGVSKNVTQINGGTQN